MCDTVTQYHIATNPAKAQRPRQTRRAEPYSPRKAPHGRHARTGLYKPHPSRRESLLKPNATTQPPGRLLTPIELVCTYECAQACCRNVGIDATWPLGMLSRHPAPGTRHPAPGTRHPAPGTRHPAPGTRHPAPGTRHPPPATQAFDSRWPASLGDPRRSKGERPDGRCAAEKLVKSRESPDDDRRPPTADRRLAHPGRHRLRPQARPPFCTEALTRFGRSPRPPRTRTRMHPKRPPQRQTLPGALRGDTRKQMGKAAKQGRGGGTARCWQFFAVRKQEYCTVVCAVRSRRKKLSR